MSKEGKLAEEKIKRKIVSGHQRGVCDKSGNSVLDSHGNMVAPQKPAPPTAKTYVYRDGKMVDKNSLDNGKGLCLSLSHD